jgi:cell division protein FtsQ
VLDELLRMFQVDDLTRGADIDLDSPEIEELLSGSTPRPRLTNVDDEHHGPHADDSHAGYRFGPGEGSASERDQQQSSERSERDQAESAAERQRVFIDDDSKLGEIVGSAEAARATGIEPKLRQRRAAVHKARGRKRLRWVVAVFAVLILVVAGLAVLGSSVFSIETVSVSDAVYSRDELQPIIDDLTGEPTLRADTGGFEERIERIPWVEEARVDTKFPDSASIEIRERVPAATFQGGDSRFRVIDSEGRVLDVVDGQPVDFMLVRSENPPSPEAGEFAPAGFVAAAAMARALTPSVRPITEVIDVANDGSDVRLALTGGTEVRLGSGDDLVDKLARLETVIDMDTDRLPARIDVSTDKVTVQETASG